MSHFFKMLLIIFIITQSKAQEIFKLEEAKPEKFDTKEGEYLYFYAILSTDKSTDVALQPLYGDTDLYGNLSSASNAASFPFPNKDSYQYSSISAVILESIHLTESDLQKYGPALKISVHCLSSQCGFVIYYDQGMYPLLADNRPMQGNAGRFQYSYYRYVRNQEESITIIVSLIGSANPDLFVSKGKPPTTSDFMWHASSLGGETLVLTEGGIGVYYIGIHCEHECSFTVTVLTHPEEFLPLYPGLPQYMATNEGTRALFYFPIYEKRWVELKISILSGDIYLLANAQNPEIEEMNEKIPSVDQYTWMSLSDNADNLIEINPNDKNMCSNCNIVVSVISSTKSRYIITEVNKSYLEVLNNGVPVHGFVDSSEIDSFMFKLEAHSSIEIVMTVHSGDADLYISTSLPVSDKIYDWKSNTQSSIETVSINVDDKDWIMGTYYMAVKGWQSSFYSILVYCEDSGIILDLGLLRRYQLAKQLHFILNQSPDIEYTCTTASLTRNSNPSIYINLDSESFPTPSKHDKSYTGNIFSAVYNSFSFNLVSGDYSTSRISIYSDSENTNNEISLVCTAPYTIMKIGQHDYTYYELRAQETEFELLVSTKHDIRVTIFYCISPVSVLISTDRTYVYSPNIFRSSYKYKEVFYIQNTHSQYFIKVAGNIEDSFEIFTETITGEEFSMTPGGEIQVKTKSNGFKVSWNKVIVNNEMVLNDIDYYIFYGKSLNNMIINYCSLTKSNHKQELKSVNVGQENQVSIEKSSGSYLTVAAVFKRHRFQPQGFAIYDLVKLESPSNSSSSNYSVPWYYVLYISLLMILAVILFKLKKARANSRQSQGYELSNY